MPRKHRSRRRLLLVASGMLVGSSGCLSNIGTTTRSNRESPTTTEIAKPILEYVNLSNHHSERHTISLQIKQEKETVHERQYQLKAFDSESDVAGTTLIQPPTFNRERGSWSVSATLNSSSEQVRIDLTDLPHQGGCINVTIRITPQGDLTALNDTPDCPKTEK